MNIPQEAKIFRPQEGPQTEFVGSSVDFCLMGGAAGGGKTFGVVLDALRYIKIPEARVIVFRRQSVDLERPGGVWQEMCGIYPLFGARVNSQLHKFIFPSGMEIQCSHLSTEADKYTYRGAQQIAAIYFEELPDFTESQFFYMFSRGRNRYGIKFYVKATCNPEPGWLADFISWYIGQDGLVIPERAGVIRYFIRDDADKTRWGSTRQEVIDDTGCEAWQVKSFQFIPAMLADNKILMESSGLEYMSNIKLSGAIEAKRLLDGNWKIKKEGKIFKQCEFMLYTRIPIDLDCKIMVCDTAQKTKEENDYSVLQVWGRKINKIYLIDQLRGKYSYPDLKIMFASFVNKHQTGLNQIYIEDKVSGTALIQELQRTCPVPILDIQRNKDKYSRAYDIQGFVAAGHVHLNPMASYYTEFISEVISFTADDTHDFDDQCDCLFDAVDKLLINPTRPIASSNNDQYISFMSRII